MDYHPIPWAQLRVLMLVLIAAAWFGVRALLAWWLRRRRGAPPTAEPASKDRRDAVPTHSR